MRRPRLPFSWPEEPASPRSREPLAVALTGALVGLAVTALSLPVLANPAAEGSGAAEAQASAPHRAAQGPEATLSPEAALARATAFYEAGQYAQCSEALGALLSDPAQSVALARRAAEQASEYRAACLIAQGDTTAADEVFRAAIRQNPQMPVPSAIVFPPAVLERFIVVRTTLLEEIRREEEARALRAREAADQARRKAAAERERVARLEKLASQETIVVKNRRWLASVPFGVGQYQNRDYALGTVFLTTELLCLATAVTATSIELSLNSQAKGGTGFTDANEVAQLNENLRTANRVALIAAGGFLVAAVGGIFQAHLAFVPEFRDGVRPRKRSEPGISPVLGPTQGGAEIGVFGRF